MGGGDNSLIAQKYSSGWYKLSLVTFILEARLSMIVKAENYEKIENGKGRIGKQYMREFKFSNEKWTYWTLKRRNFSIGNEKYPNLKLVMRKFKIDLKKVE